MKISIIVTSYNSEATIQETITSIAQQTYKNFEVIFIDGMSTDSTQDIINQSIDILPSSRCIFEKDEGIYDAFNKGLYYSTGEIVHFLNSDDVYYSIGVLEFVNDVFTNSDTKCLSTSILMTNLTMERTIRKWSSKIGKVGLGWVPAFTGLFFKKELPENIGVFDQDFQIAADMDWILRAIRYSGVKFKSKDKTTVKMRYGGESTRVRAVIYKNFIESRAVYKKHNFPFPTITAIIKQLRKIPQFLL